ncbi:MAG: helix-turn-helix transcriptional regulator, partial [Candidatus Bathyarchaeota archaeon]
MARQLREDVEEVVLQALGHRERRNILEIVASSGDGVLYSDILHELGMNTGKLNYHLKLLEGVIEKDESRRYRLTDLGLRALRLLRSLTEDLDEESVRRFSSVKGRRDEFVVGVVNWYFNL